MVSKLGLLSDHSYLALWRSEEPVRAVASRPALLPYIDFLGLLKEDGN